MISAKLSLVTSLVMLSACSDPHTSKSTHIGKLGVFDPYWARDQWQWTDIDGHGFIKHKTATDCYIEGKDFSGEVFTDDRIMTEEKVLFGASYHIIRTYDETDTLKEVYYSTESKNGLSYVLSVFVGNESEQCLLHAENILKKYESNRSRQ